MGLEGQGEDREGAFRKGERQGQQPGGQVVSALELWAGMSGQAEEGRKRDKPGIGVRCS